MTPKQSSSFYDCIILGAGAAGLFCAARAGQKGKRVALIDHASVLGEKIRISGGGRCNFTNVNASPKQYLSQNPHFCRSALARYVPEDFINLVKKHRISFHEKTLGQLFCDHSSQQIITMLVEECNYGKVTIINPVKVSAVSKADLFEVRTEKGIFTTPKLVIASGGLSIPAIGATSFGYEIAKQFNIKVVPLRPGLVPLALEGEEFKTYSELSGIAFNTTVTCKSSSIEFSEAALLTHRGLSGPAILQISNYLKMGEPLSLNLLPGFDSKQWLDDTRKHNTPFLKAFTKHIPQRFAESWTSLYTPENGTKPVAQWTKLEMNNVISNLTAWKLHPSGTLGYKKAEVTLGGIDTNELSQQTMESKKVPGLHFIGEVVDVTGWLGGYNFQWAWASAAACGDSV
jgi:predicted Rossmann fold flavoprotein